MGPDGRKARCSPVAMTLMPRAIASSAACCRFKATYTKVDVTIKKNGVTSSSFVQNFCCTYESTFFNSKSLLLRRENDS